MPLSKFKANLQSFIKTIDHITDEFSNIADFKTTQANYYKNVAKGKISGMKDEMSLLLQKPDQLNHAHKALTIIKEMEEIYDSAYPKEDKKRRLNRKVEELAGILEKLDIKDEPQEFEKNYLKLPELPMEIESEVVSDVKEMRRCFDSGCYKASTILCGRILETALHRLYFEKTNSDLLETSPGIGLGKIISKLFENGISLGPGINDQIHLINNVRISSVHKKKDVFNPSKEQTQAIMIFTIDVLNRAFRKNG